MYEGVNALVFLSHEKSDAGANLVYSRKFGVMRKIVSNRSARALRCAAVHFEHPNYYRYLGGGQYSNINQKLFYGIYFALKCINFVCFEISSSFLGK